ncbi:Hemolysin-type calcium-binding region [[Leptolyngbya] sp. PCC 7376]|uniref:hemolysin-type calcium-binding protein n=1 Tax=[Leptolyngbya] sp. PCC 7376 TaxID=111781 RepID=UPI00029EE952|nr:hemolysin-type calcium-binding protein [[Leptolyngbya] sp. PCC 7376]AFY39532.1 Hemolysin-type calcium-binding region [[Leptolyngbya] sp. PCC 7376]
MSTDHRHNPEIQAYLDLNKEIEETIESDLFSESNTGYFNGANFALTTLLTYAPGFLRLSTIQSYAAYYAIMFAGEFISAMLERYGEDEIAGYFGNDYGIDFDSGLDTLEANAYESLVQAAYDVLQGINTSIDLFFEFNIGSSLGQTLKDAINGTRPTLMYDETQEKEGFIFNYTEYIFREGDGNDYLDFEDRRHNSRSTSQIIVYAGKGKDYIANVKKAYGENGDDQIKDVKYAWGGTGDDYITNVKYEAYGENDNDYISSAKKAYGGNHDDYITDSDEAYGEDGQDILVDNKKADGGEGNDTLLGNGDSYGREGDDYIIGSHSRGNGNILNGGADDDTVIGQDKNDVLKGGTGSDILIGGGGNDLIDGGEDSLYDNDLASDVAIFRNDANFTFTKQSGTWEYRVSGQGIDEFKNIESVVVEAGDSDNTIDASALEISSNLDGRAGNDIIKGGGNNDILVGGLGNDRLIAGLGFDYLDGGQGNDILIGSGTSDVGRYSETELAVARGELPESALRSPLVTIYQHDSYGGKSKAFYDLGNFTDHQLGIGNDALSSLKVADGYRVTLYQHHNRTGNSLTHDFSTTYIGDWFNDETSSIVIEKAPPVTIYRDGSYRGRRQELSVGSYNVGGLSYIGNEQLSSLKVAEGYEVTLYEHANFSGDSISFTSNTSYVGNGFDNETSSIKVEKLLEVDDVLVGGAGNDLLDGGDGHDYLTGGTGADKFVLRNPNSYDVITDFNASQGDEIWLDRDAFPGMASYNIPTQTLSMGGKKIFALENAVGFNAHEHIKFVSAEQLDAHTSLPGTERAIGEYGTVDNLTHVWQTIELDGNYIDPVVIASDPTFNGSDFSGIRLRNVDSDSFEIRIQEADYLNDIHTFGETVSFFVVEAGEWELADGTRIAAGLHRTDNLITAQNDFDTIDFTDNGLTDFVSAPTVLSQIQTNGTNEGGSQWVTTRLKGQSSTGFSLGMQEEDSLNTGNHVEETIGWLAIEQGVSHDADGDLLLQGGTTGASVDENWETISFGEGFDVTPTLIAKLGSTRGLDPSVLRLDSGSISTTGFDAFVQEDQSLTPEIGHNHESVSYLAFNGNSGTLTGFEL